MSSSDIKPFKVAIPDDELTLLRKKLELVRLPTNLANSQWGEENGVSLKLMQETVQFWLSEYDWRRVEGEINLMPQFKTVIPHEKFGDFDIHFVHSRAKTSGNRIPLLFLHGWPGSFIEVQKVLGMWNEAGFDVVAPSLPGYGFSSYTEKDGFKFFHVADVMHQVMIKLGYEKYVVQGGDWGSLIGRSVAQRYPDNAKALHLNMLVMPQPSFEKEPEYTPREAAQLKQSEWFNKKETAYQQVQSTKTRTLGFAMHDSPVAMLAWMVDKLLVWTDSYPWTPTELITWTLLHYFPGPTTGFQMYRENMTPRFELPEEYVTGDPPGYLKTPVGLSAFPKEIVMVPKSWAETANNVVFYKTHEKGGHFAAWERPKELGNDVIEFVNANWTQN